MGKEGVKPGRETDEKGESRVGESEGGKESRTE